MEITEQALALHNRLAAEQLPNYRLIKVKPLFSRPFPGGVTFGDGRVRCDIFCPCFKDLLVFWILHDGKKAKRFGEIPFDDVGTIVSMWRLARARANAMRDLLQLRRRRSRSRRAADRQ